MGIICNISDGWEYYIARAELFYSENKFNDALAEGKMAKNYAQTKARQTAIGIFIAKCYSALGDYKKSSLTYRELIKESIYLPPVIMGMMYNNLKTKNKEKAVKNITLVKMYDN
jgi:hypothetical protein